MGAFEQRFSVCYVFFVSALGVVGLVHLPRGWVLVLERGFVVCLLAEVECFSYLFFGCGCLSFLWCWWGGVFSFFDYELAVFRLNF